MENKEFTVSEFLSFLNKFLIPQKAIIVGEVGERIREYPNFFYFRLLDPKEKSILNCFVWRRNLENSGMRLEEGKKVKIFGFPEIYEPNGELNFQVEQISFLEEGDLKKAFEALKKKLELEGFFALERKKPVPKFCRKIGLITSKYGEGALPDFKKHLGAYGFLVYFYSVRVEGMSAIDELVEAVKWFNENMTDIDVLVLIRGGGSWESLQAFNSEVLAKAIFASKIPVICGIGHEKDVTIASLVADFRASTPTDAAKFLSENWNLALVNIPKYEKSLYVLLRNRFKNVKEKLIFFRGKMTNSLQTLIKEKRAENKELFEEFQDNKDLWLKKLYDLLRQQQERLNPSNPDLKLKQGYSITFDNSEQIIKDPKKVKVGQLIKTKFYKGHIFSQIKKK